MQMKKTITDRVSWVGKVDWELTTFHGEEYSTWRGSSYNSYLVRDEKLPSSTLSGCPLPKSSSPTLKQTVDLSTIDYIIVNHAEIDHSGALPLLMKESQINLSTAPKRHQVPQGHYHQDWNFVPVKTGDTIQLGSTSLVFVEAPMLHWPDSMFTYMTGENILFSNDAFGQHYATELLYNDLVDQCELFAEAIKYYANILTPFSSLVTKKINEVLDLGLPVDMICPATVSFGEKTRCK